MNLELDGDLATIDGSHDGVRTRASPKLIIAPKSAELALRLAKRLYLPHPTPPKYSSFGPYKSDFGPEGMFTNDYGCA